MTRILDVLLSGIAIVVLSPLFIPIMIVLKLTGEHHVFYQQTRIGRGGTPFGLIKFATMLKDSPKLGSGEITLRNDPRVLPVGRVLRKTKINELPQIFNIFKGDMSVVGPRPMTERNFAYYSQTCQQRIATVRPGLTGVGSIFFRDEERFLQGKDDPIQFYKDHIAPYKAELEMWYLDNRSLWLYCKLILLTIWVVLFSGSTLPDKTLKGLPEKPAELMI